MTKAWPTTKPNTARDNSSGSKNKPPPSTCNSFPRRRLHFEFLESAAEGSAAFDFDVALAVDFDLDSASAHKLITSSTPTPNSSPIPTTPFLGVVIMCCHPEA